MPNHLLFVQPVVNAFDPRVLVAPEISHVINFTSVKVCGLGNHLICFSISNAKCLVVVSRA